MLLWRTLPHPFRIGWNLGGCVFSSIVPFSRFTLSLASLPLDLFTCLLRFGRRMCASPSLTTFEFIFCPARNAFTSDNKLWAIYLWLLLLFPLFQWPCFTSLYCYLGNYDLIDAIPRYFDREVMHAFQKLPSNGCERRVTKIDLSFGKMGKTRN